MCVVHKESFLKNFCWSGPVLGNISSSQSFPQQSHWLLKVCWEKDCEEEFFLKLGQSSRNSYSHSLTVPFAKHCPYGSLIGNKKIFSYQNTQYNKRMAKTFKKLTYWLPSRLLSSSSPGSCTPAQPGFLAVFVTLSPLPIASV